MLAFTAHICTRACVHLKCNLVLAQALWAVICGCAPPPDPWATVVSVRCDDHCGR